MPKYNFLLVLLLLSGCHSPAQKQEGIAPIGNAPQYSKTDSNDVKGEPGNMDTPSTKSAACNEYRGMMVAPIEPVALKVLQDKCEQK